MSYVTRPWEKFRCAFILILCIFLLLESGNYSTMTKYSTMNQNFTPNFSSKSFVYGSSRPMTVRLFPFLYKYFTVVYLFEKHSTYWAKLKKYFVCVTVRMCILSKYWKWVMGIVLVRCDISQVSSNQQPHEKKV